MDFPSVIDEKIHIVEKNLFRRHMVDYQKIERTTPLEALVAEKARLREVAGTLTSNEDRGRTSELTAKAIGVSKATYERAKKIRDEGIPRRRPRDYLTP
jgi:hypothetical protein